MIITRIRRRQIIPSLRVGACTLLFSSVICSVVTSADAQPKNTIVANITVGHGPTAITVSPNNAYVYVANNFDHTVSVISTATNAVIATIDAGDLPDAVAVTPDGSTLYVADWKGNVSVIKTSTNTKVATVPVGQQSLSLAVSPDGKSLYAPFYHGIRVIDTSNHRVTAMIPLNTNVDPIQILFNPDNKLAYALCYDGVGKGRNEQSLGGILQINTKTFQTKQRLWQKLPGATTVAITPDGSKLYIVDQIETPPTAPYHADLVIFDTVSQQKQATVSLDPSLAIPIASAITPNGQYLYLPTTLDAVLMIDTSTNTVDATINVTVGASAIAIAPNGNFAYVASTGANNNPGSVTVIDISSN